MRNASFRTKVGQVSDSRPTRTLGRIEEYAYISLPVKLSLSDLSDFVRLVRLLSDMFDMSDTVRLLSDLSEIPGPAQTSRTGHSDGCPVRLVRLKSDSDTSPKNLLISGEAGLFPEIYPEISFRSRRVYSV